MPCYAFFYRNAPARLRTMMDRREEQVAQAEQVTNESKTNIDTTSIQKVLSHTVVTRQLVDLFIENMSAKDEEEKEVFEHENSRKS